MTGRVYLVGSGPGDPDLLTLKALRLLKTADVVLYDDLVTAEILSLVSPAARLYNVGKRCGTKKITQAEINFLMVSLALCGLKVVRLKSGDPLIFGRCGEEIEVLRKAGIEYEIVPGITAALGAAAAAGIPLTHREISHAVVLLTGHVSDQIADGDWQRLVSGGATLAIYMPGHHYAELAARLMNAGLSGDTPCAVISAATTPQQEMEVTTLLELASIRRYATPSLVVVGEVVKLALRSVKEHFTLNQKSELSGRSHGISEVQSFVAEEEIA